MDLSLIIILILLVCFIALIIARKYYVKSILKLKTEKNYEAYFKKLDSGVTKLLLPKISRLYMKLNAYKALQDSDHVDMVIDEMLKLEMNTIQKEDFDFHQSHYYILRKDEKYIDIFMKRLEEQKNQKYLKIAQLAYEVLVKGRNDLIEEVDKEIDFLKGNNLGIACYLIGMQYLRLEDKPQAKLYFQSAVVVTVGCIYDSLTKKQLKDLEDVVAAQPED